MVDKVQLGTDTKHLGMELVRYMGFGRDISSNSQSGAYIFAPSSNAIPLKLQPTSAL